MKKYNVGIVGATGAVGEEIALILEEQNFPVKELVPLASSRSLGKSVTFNNREIPVVELTPSVFAEHHIELAFFSAGGSVSAEFVPHATKAGAIVIDNTSHFRMQENVPLVVPEVNPQDIALCKETGIIANYTSASESNVSMSAPTKP